MPESGQCHVSIQNRQCFVIFHFPGNKQVRTGLPCLFDKISACSGTGCHGTNLFFRISDIVSLSRCQCTPDLPQIRLQKLFFRQFPNPSESGLVPIQTIPAFCKRTNILKPQQLCQGIIRPAHCLVKIGVSRINCNPRVQKLQKQGTFRTAVIDGADRPEQNRMVTDDQIDLFPFCNSDSLCSHIQGNHDPSDRSHTAASQQPHIVPGFCLLRRCQFFHNPYNVLYLTWQ